MSYPGSGKMYRDNERAGKRRPARDPVKTGSGSDDATIAEEAACVTCGETFAKGNMFVTEAGDVCVAHFTG
jgi:ribosomal protein L24E